MPYNTLLVGCGENQIKRIKRCIAIDISEDYLRESKRKRSDNFYLLADVNSLPFIGGNFNKIICTEVLEHTQNPEEALSEISRVMTSDGVLYLSVPLEEICKNLAEVFPAYKKDFYYGHHKSNFTVQSLIRLFKKYKFQHLKIRYFGKENYYYWHILARLVNILNLDVGIEESGKVCLNSDSIIKKKLFRNLLRSIRIFSFLGKIFPNNNYTNIFVEARK